MLRTVPGRRLRSSAPGRRGWSAPARAKSRGRTGRNPPACRVRATPSLFPRTRHRRRPGSRPGAPRPESFSCRRGRRAPAPFGVTPPENTRRPCLRVRPKGNLHFGIQQGAAGKEVLGRRLARGGTLVGVCEQWGLPTGDGAQCGHPRDCVGRHVVEIVSAGPARTGVKQSDFRRGPILAVGYNSIVGWEVEVTDEFKAWWDGLNEAEQVSVERAVLVLQERGPYLEFPYSSKITRSRHPGMRELRVQHRGHAVRVLYVFDPRRAAILLLGGDKTGDDRWYERNVPLADRVYDEYLKEIKEGKNAKDDEME